MRFIELFLLRMLLWIGLPVVLLMLAVGPQRLWSRVMFGWNWLFRKRLEPEEILSQVVEQHQQHVAALKKVVAQAEAAEKQIQENLDLSELHAAEFEQEAAKLANQGDELGARAALYKLNLEKSAVEGFREQLTRQRQLIPETRQHLYLLELRLRQYEVGRSVLLSQLAEAEKAEQQYAIAQQFDPFNAIANWQRAEGMVQEKTINARAIERVCKDTAEIAADLKPIEIDSVEIENQLAKLRSLSPTSQPEATEPANNDPPAKQKHSHKH